MEFPLQFFFKPEFSSSRYDIQETFFLGEKCWKITVSLPNDKESLREIKEKLGANAEVLND